MLSQALSDFVEQLRQALESRNYQAFAACFDPHGVYELPYALHGQPSRYHGAEQIQKYIEAGMTAANKLFDVVQVGASVHLGAAEGVVFVEFFLTGKRFSDHTTFQVASSTALITGQAGKVITYRDFPNSLGIAQAVGRLPEFAAALPKE